MLSFPTHPRYARMFLAAGELGCVRAAAMIAALTQTRSLFPRADRRAEAERDELFGGGSSDFSVLIRAQRWAENNGFSAERCRSLGVHGEAARQAGKLAAQFLDIARGEKLREETSPPGDDAIAKCILAGFADQVARRRSRGALICDVVHGRRGMLARTSVAQNGLLLVAAEINEIGGKGGEAQVTLSLATEIKEEWLEELFPGHLVNSSSPAFDTALNRVVLRRTKRFRDLVLETSDRDATPDAATAAILSSAIAENELRLNGWDDAAEQFAQRVNFLAREMPELGLSPIGDLERDAVRDALCEGALAYREVKDRPALPFLRALFRGDQLAAIDRHAPERHELPGGRKAKIVYAASAEPVLAARIQDLYGVEGGIKIASGRCAVTIQILAPNMRPVQITRDLTNFWREAYPKLKVELGRKYPRHEWR